MANVVKLGEARIAQFADNLFNAERSRVQIAPLTDQEPGFGVDDAYAVQLHNVARVVGMGHVISGKKIGLTSPGIQKQMGVNEPDYGHLFAAMDAAGGDVRAGDLIQPKIEAELAFVLKADLAGGEVTVDDVRRATDYVAAAFEIVDSRIVDWKIKLPDTIADNASSGRYVLGEGRLPVTAGLDLAAIKMKMFKGKLGGEAKEPVGEGAGAAVLGDPCVAVAWLANRLWGYGVTLKAGEVILSGAFAAAPLAAKGDVFVADFTELGRVEARFV
jgi:2-keto-4-pentenoate hydratase